MLHSLCYRLGRRRCFQCCYHHPLSPSFTQELSPMPGCSSVHWLAAGWQWGRQSRAAVCNAATILLHSPPPLASHPAFLRFFLSMSLSSLAFQSTFSFPAIPTLSLSSVPSPRRTPPSRSLDASARTIRTVCLFILCARGRVSGSFPVETGGEKCHWGLVYKPWPAASPSTVLWRSKRYVCSTFVAGRMFLGRFCPLSWEKRRGRREGKWLAKTKKTDVRTAEGV